MSGSGRAARRKGPVMLAAAGRGWLRWRRGSRHRITRPRTATGSAGHQRASGDGHTPAFAVRGERGSWWGRRSTATRSSSEPLQMDPHASAPETAKLTRPTTSRQPRGMRGAPRERSEGSRSPAAGRAHPSYRCREPPSTSNEPSDRSPIPPATRVNARTVRQFPQQFARTLGPLPRSPPLCGSDPSDRSPISPSSFSRTLRPFPHLRRCRVRPLGPFAKIPRNFHEPSDRSPDFPRNFHEPSEGSPRGPPARKGPLGPFRSPPEGLWATFGPYPHGPWLFSTPHPTVRRNSHGLFGTFRPLPSSCHGLFGVPGPIESGLVGYAPQEGERSARTARIASSTSRRRRSHSCSITNAGRSTPLRTSSAASSRRFTRRTTAR